MIPTPGPAPNLIPCPGQGPDPVQEHLYLEPAGKPFDLLYLRLRQLMLQPLQQRRHEKTRKPLEINELLLKTVSYISILHQYAFTKTDLTS